MENTEASKLQRLALLGNLSTLTLAAKALTIAGAIILATTGA
jgi:hypothetical protein